ncbi:MAG: hypothetical protein ABEJ42_00520 [Halobacteriaceae archaeon]
MPDAPTRSVVGTCPVCAAELSVGDVLIRYRTSAGTVAAFADCAGCGDVVRPRRPGDDP